MNAQGEEVGADTNGRILANEALFGGEYTTSSFFSQVDPKFLAKLISF